MIKTILWDVDRTLLDFDAAERAAIQSLFVEFGLSECSEEQVARYSVLNMKYWEKLERGEITKPQVLVGRFEEFFAEEGIDVALAPKFNDAYQLRLGDTIVYRDDSYEIVKSLRGKVRQCVVSNGTVVAQTKKLTRSGLGALMDGVFLSEQLGAEKPKKEFFDQVFAAIGPVEKSETMIVGDSLTSDIRGGDNAGIVTLLVQSRGNQSAGGLPHRPRDQGSARGLRPAVTRKGKRTFRKESECPLFCVYCLSFSRRRQMQSVLTSKGLEMCASIPASRLCCTYITQCIDKSCGFIQY